MSDIKSELGDEGEDESGKEENETAKDRGAGPFEIAATAISALIIAAVLSVLIVDAFHPHTPPAFAAQPGPFTTARGEYRVPITVRNSGDGAAKAVVVHVELLASDSVLVESDLTIDWLPGNTSKELVALLVRATPSPVPTGVRAEVRGYATP